MVIPNGVKHREESRYKQHRCEIFVEQKVIR